MVIVVNLSKQMVGYNLFESFFYKFKNDGTLIFINDFKNDNLNYDELKINIQNILYDNHASSFSLCLLYDMDIQMINPIANSISFNIKRIKDRIIKPLLPDYIFDRLYYFQLDNIKRDYDGYIYDDNIRLGIEFDSLGYLNNTYNSKYNDIVFDINELNKMDYIYNKLNELYNDNLEKIIDNFKLELRNIFDNKINKIDEYEDLFFYKDSLNKVYNIVINDIENKLYKNIDNIQVSKLISDILKMEISTKHYRDTIILHFNLFDRYTNMNKEILRYRHQLEIIGMILYITFNDMKMVFESGQSISRENHYQILVKLNDLNITRLLKSYNSKLWIELDKKSKYQNNEIEYEEYSSGNFNLLDQTNKPILAKIPKYKLFYKKGEEVNTYNYANSLYDRYLTGIDYSNKRVRDLTIQLRVQKENICTGKLKKGNVLELSNELEIIEEDVITLQKKIALYKPNEVVEVDNNILLKYMEIVDNIKVLLTKRIKDTTFVKNIILISMVTLLSYPIINQSQLSNKINDILMMIMLIIPVLSYITIQISYLYYIKHRIKKKILELRNSNELVVNKLFSSSNEALVYVLNLYNLIMKKKYINECKKRIIESNKIFLQHKYHYDKLKEHYETSNKLIEMLGLKNINIQPLEVDKINDINEICNVYENDIYCPINYLYLMSDIKNKTIINDSKNIDINSSLLGFISEFIISYDKEYQND